MRRLATRDRVYQTLVHIGKEPIQGGRTGKRIARLFTGWPPPAEFPSRLGHLDGLTLTRIFPVVVQTHPVELTQNHVSDGRSPTVQTPLLKYRHPIIVLSQLFLFALTYYFSFLLRFDFNLHEPFTHSFLKTLPVVVSVKLLVFSYFRLFRGWWRYVGMSDLLDIIKAAAISAPLVYLAVYLAHGMLFFPRSVCVIDLTLTICAIGGIRFAVRAYTESARVHLADANTLIIGAGSAGSAIIRELRGNGKVKYDPVGFIDDDPTKQGMKLQGVKVLGTSEHLPRIIKENDVAHILIAIPSAAGKQIQRIIDKCRACKVDFKTLPAYGDIINGSVSVGHIRNVRVEDLLRRAPVQMDLGRIREKLQGKVVLITGAGGSIGSELARQVANVEPGELVLFDQSENDLHKIDIDLAENFPRLDYAALVGDILDRDRLSDVMAQHRPHFVFHAAAYKHVPMMEKNCFQAVTNNIFGTYHAAHLAREFEVQDFVLISSDKAVNPSNIMGVTKRVSELLILGLQHQRTHFVSVRFGNVLGSKGSVLPLFEEQIARRRPVTVTHPEACRYFMTIPEAVQLVLQAATMGKGGEIFVLDMGEPIKIVDVAHDLIRLSGLEPERDIPIVYTGLRPGEKLFEELKLDEEGIKPTAHEKIRVLEGGRVSSRQVEIWIKELEARTNAKDVNGLIRKLREIVPEYSPSQEILALAQESVYEPLTMSMSAGSPSVKWTRKQSS